MHGIGLCGITGIAGAALFAALYAIPAGGHEGYTRKAAFHENEKPTPNSTAKG
jgi:hypothetical protein